MKWNVEVVAREFGLASVTLRKALAKTSATPDADGLFTTKQVVAALYGSMDLEKLATQREVRRKLELENAVTTAALLNKDALTHSTCTRQGSNLQSYDPKSYTLSICTAGASENGLADAGVNTHLRLEFGQRSLGDTPNGRLARVHLLLVERSIDLAIEFSLGRVGDSEAAG